MRRTKVAAIDDYQEEAQSFNSVADVKEVTDEEIAVLKKGCHMTLTEFFNKKYRERKDKDNMYGVGMSDAEFRQFIIDYLLPDDWCVADPLGQSQINEIAIYEILEKHSKKFRKERRRAHRGTKRRR